jgi:hypothetical protein
LVTEVNAAKEKTGYNNNRIEPGKHGTTGTPIE